MRIQHNVSALNAYRNYNNNTSQVNKNLEKLSSGYRINRAGDDAAGLAVSQKMRLQIAGLDQAQKNAKSAVTYIQTAEGSLQEVHDMLERMYTLAEQSANGTYDSSTDRVQLDKEVTALKTEIDRIGQTANFNGLGIFQDYVDESIGGSGAASVGTSQKTKDTTFWIGPDDNTNNKINIGRLNLSKATMSFVSGDSKTPSTSNVGNISAVNIATATAAKTSLASIRQASNAISDMRGTLGAYQNRIEHTLKNLSVTHENMTEAESVIRDTDVADEMMKYTKNNILIQSAQAMLAQANQLPQGVLQLLQ